MDVYIKFPSPTFLSGLAIFAYRFALNSAVKKLREGFGIG